MKGPIYLILIFGSGLLFSCATPSSLANLAINKGDQFNNTNQYDQAIVEYNKYLELAPSLGIYRNLLREAGVHRRIANAYSSRGEYSESLEHISYALEIDNQIDENEVNISEDYRQLGLVHAYLGDYPQAIANLEESITRSEGMEESVKDQKKLVVADTRLALSQVHFTLGNYTESLEESNDAMSVYTTIDNEIRGRLESTLIKGMVLLEQGHLTDAVTSLEESAKLAREGNFTQFRQYNTLSNVFELKGELEEALRQRLMGLDEAEKSGIHPQIIMAYVKLGDIYQLIGDEEKANEYFKKALEKQKEGTSVSLLPTIELRLGDMKAAQTYLAQSNSKIGAGSAALKLGDIDHELGNMDQALEYYRQALDLFEDTESYSGQSRASLKLGIALLDAGRTDEAKPYLDKSIELASTEVNWQIEHALGRYFVTINDFETARDHFIKSLQIIEKVRGNLTVEEFKTRFLDDKTNVYDDIIQLLLENEAYFRKTGIDPASEAFHYSEMARARTFLDMISNKELVAKEQTHEELLQAEIVLRRKIEKLHKELQRSSSIEIRTELNSSIDQHSELIEKIKLESNSYKEVLSVQPSSLSEIQEQLDNRTAVLEYWLGEEGSFMFVLSKDEIIYFPLSATKNEIERTVKATRLLLRLKNDDGTLKNFLRELYEQMILPAYESLSSVTNLIIIPHRGLHFVPFQSFLDSAEKPLVTSYSISYAPSASLLLSESRPSVTENLLSLALGDVALEGFTNLPGTRREVEHIEQLYSEHTSLLEDASLERSFKEQSSKYSTIHIATHGVFNKYQPLYSYLLMLPDDEQDGFLTVNEIFDLDLNTELVILSACETGLGTVTGGDELTGLSRAFMYAGTRSIVVSLWKVDDTITALLMTRLHAYLSGGLTPSGALRQAQLDIFGNTKPGVDEKIEYSNELKKAFDQSNEHPYYWAPFVLISSSTN